MYLKSGQRPATAPIGYVGEIFGGLLYSPGIPLLSPRAEPN